MHAARVDQWGQPPKYVEVPTPDAPALESDTVQLNVLAAGLHRVVRSRAAGRHYTATGLPHTPGIDGVGTTPDGKKVYFFFMDPATGGSFIEIINIPKRSTTPLPENTDPKQIAALVNPGISSWMALTERCENIPESFSVLIMGVTSKSGQLAVTLARHLGAQRVVGVARNEEAMKSLNLDESIILKDPVDETDFSELGHVDVILDYLYGEPAAHLLKSLKPQGKVQYVHIGSLAGLEMALPGEVIRSNDLVIRGSGPGAFSMRNVPKHLPPFLAALAKVPEQKVRVEKLEDVEMVWQEESERVVFVP